MIKFHSPAKTEGIVAVACSDLLGAFEMTMDLIAFKAKRKNEPIGARVIVPNITKRNLGSRKFSNFPRGTVQGVLPGIQTLKSIRIMINHSRDFKKFPVPQFLQAEFIQTRRVTNIRM